MENNTRNTEGLSEMENRLGKKTERTHPNGYKSRKYKAEKGWKKLKHVKLYEEFLAEEINPEGPVRVATGAGHRTNNGVPTRKLEVASAEKPTGDEFVDGEEPETEDPETEETDDDFVDKKKGKDDETETDDEETEEDETPEDND